MRIERARGERWRSGAGRDGTGARAPRTRWNAGPGKAGRERELQEPRPGLALLSVRGSSLDPIPPRETVSSIAASTAARFLPSRSRRCELLDELLRSQLTDPTAAGNRSRYLACPSRQARSRCGPKDLSRSKPSLTRFRRDPGVGARSDRLDRQTRRMDPNLRPLTGPWRSRRGRRGRTRSRGGGRRAGSSSPLANRCGRRRESTCRRRSAAGGRRGRGQHPCATCRPRRSRSGSV